MISEGALSSLGLEHGVCLWGWRRRWVGGQPFPVPCWVFHCFYLECGINHCAVLNRGVSWMCLHFRKLSCKKYRRYNGRETLRIVVQLLNHVWLWDPVNCSALGLPVVHRLLEFAQTYVCWVNDAIQPSCPLSCPSSPAFNLFQDQDLSNESALCIRWPKYWSFSFSISPSSEYSGLIFFKIDWFCPSLCRWRKSVRGLLLVRNEGAHNSDCSRGRGFANLWAVRQDLENN